MVELALTDDDIKAIVKYTMEPQFLLNSSLTTVSKKVVNVVKNANGDITVNGAVGSSGQTPVIISKSEVEKIEKNLEDDNIKKN